LCACAPTSPQVWRAHVRAGLHARCNARALVPRGRRTARIVWVCDSCVCVCVRQVRCWNTRTWCACVRVQLGGSFVPTRTHACLLGGSLVSCACMHVHDTARHKHAQTQSCTQLGGSPVPTWHPHPCLLGGSLVSCVCTSRVHDTNTRTQLGGSPMPTWHPHPCLLGGSLVSCVCMSRVHDTNTRTQLGGSPMPTCPAPMLAWGLARVVRVHVTRARARHKHTAIVHATWGLARADLGTRTRACLLGGSLVSCVCMCVHDTNTCTQLGGSPVPTPAPPPMLACLGARSCRACARHACTTQTRARNLGARPCRLGTRTHACLGARSCRACACHVHVRARHGTNTHKRNRARNLGARPCRLGHPHPCLLAWGLARVVRMRARARHTARHGTNTHKRNRARSLGARPCQLVPHPCLLACLLGGSLVSCVCMSRVHVRARHKHTAQTRGTPTNEPPSISFEREGKKKRERYICCHIYICVYVYESTEQRLNLRGS